MSKLSLSVALAALVAVPLVTSSAHADTKAYTAAKTSLGGTADMVIGINVSSITASKLFQNTVWPAMLAKGGADMKEGLELANKECGIDPVKAVSDVVIAMDHTTKQGVVYVGLNKLDQAALESCVTKIGTKKKKPIPTFKKDGKIVEVTPGKGDTGDKKYYAWITADVIAMSTKGDKDSLVKWTGGKGVDPKSGLGTVLGKVSTTGAVFGAANVQTEVKPGVKLSGGYGSVALTGGNLNADVNAIMADAKTATAIADEAKKQLAAVTGKASGMPAGIVKALSGVKIAAVASEVQVKASMPEADVATLLTLAMMKM